MVITPPKIDPRDQQMLVEQVRDLIVHYCPEYKDASNIRSDKYADALIQIFSRMMEITISRLNKVPDKNFLTFLDLIGVRLIPPRVALAPLIFTLAKGARQYGFVPPRTQIATAKTKEKESVVFETVKPLTVILPKLIKAASISPHEDKWTDHSLILASKAGDDVFLFRGLDRVPHRLYLGHRKFFGFKEKTNISLQIVIQETKVDVQDGLEVDWYCYKEDSKYPVKLEVTGSVSQYNKNDPLVKNLLKSGTITFSNVQGIAEKELNGFEEGTYDKKTWKSNWIFAELKKPLTGDRLPVIDTIKAGVKIKSESPVPIDSAYFNNIPIDISKDFYPFGEKPRFNDTFYIGSKTAFSKEGAVIKIEVTLSGEMPDTKNIKLIWEFWDGIGWGKLGETGDTIVTGNVVKIKSQGNFKFSDLTSAFRNKGEITFNCPAIKPVKIKEISADENCWIRVRINGGNYGQEASYEEKNASWVYNKPTYKPPIISAMTIGYEFTPEGEDIEIALSYNDFLYHDQTMACNIENIYFKPFSKLADEHQSLYLGFDKSIATLPVTIFFPLLEKVAGARRTPVLAERTGTISSIAVNVTGKNTKFSSELKAGDSIKSMGQERIVETIISDSALVIDSPFKPELIGDSDFSYFTFASIVWEYWTEKGWSELKIEDGTKNMTKREIVQFLAPYDIAMKPGFGFEEECFWIRAKLAKGHYEDFPRLRAIYTNTVWAHNRITVENEHLGSSDGKPGQVFKFSLSPVLEQKVMIKEVSLTEEEKRIVVKEEGKDAIEDIRNEKGNVTGHQVRWHEVEHFYFSKPDSRHYVIDRNNGKITFGDGERGKIPPAGRDNINSSYVTGGGIRGNVEEGMITKIRTSLPYIDSVTNPEAADGGGDQENLDRVRERGPQTLKHRDRAVTYEDFEWLVREASPKVARVKCLPTRDTSLKFEPGWVTLIIVPESKDPKPLPSQELISTIENYIFSRTSTYLTTSPSQINLIGPGYIQVTIEAAVQFESIAEAKAIEGRIINNLNEFLHPLRGGPDKKGWEFGRSVYISEIYEVIENTVGVDHVDELLINANIQIYKFNLQSGVNLDFSYPKDSRVESESVVDKPIVFSLADGISQGEIGTLIVCGFREGDHIILRNGNISSTLLINSVRRDTNFDVLGFEATRIDNVFPLCSVVETSDERVKSFLFEGLTEGNISEIKVAKLKNGDKIILKHRDFPTKTKNAVIDSVIPTKTENIRIDSKMGRIETIFIGDNYLIYSGPHTINKKVG